MISDKHKQFQELCKLREIERLDFIKNKFEPSADISFNGKNSVFLSFDEKYYNLYAKPCLMSIVHNTTDEIIFVRGINLSDDSISQMRKMSNRIDIKNFDYKLHFEMKDFASQIRSKYISEELLEYDIGKLLYVDADSMIRKPLRSIWEFCGDNDFSCRERGTNAESNHYTAGVLLFNNNDKTKTFCNIWNTIVWEKVKFYQDQIGIFRTMRSEWAKNNIKFKPLSRIYWETGRGQNAVIFCPWGKGKIAPWFVEEQVKYNKMLESIK